MFRNHTKFPQVHSSRICDQIFVMTTVIVIDDDKDTVNVLTEFLQLKGIEVIGKGHDGIQAVDLYQKQNLM